MGPYRQNPIFDTVPVVFASIAEQHQQSQQRLNTSAQTTTEWLHAAIKHRKQQILQAKHKNTSEEDKQPAKKKPKVESALPPSIVEFVYSLRVRELSAELRDRGLDGYGVKKDLQKRLLEAFEKEKADQQESETATDSGLQEYSNECNDEPVGKESMEVENEVLVPTQNVEGGSHAQAMDVEPHTASSKAVDMETASPGGQVNNEMAPSPSPHRGRSPLKIVKSGMKSALRALSPRVQKNVNSLVQKIEGKQDPAREEQTITTTSSRDDTSLSKADSTKLSTGSASGPPTLQNPPRSMPNTASMSAKAKSLKASQEARRAKLAEMRSKSKPIATSTSSISSVPTLCKVKSVTASSQAKTKDEKKQLLAAQMREKATAKLQTEKSNNNLEQQTKENSPNKKVTGGPDSSTLKEASAQHSKSAQQLRSVVLSPGKFWGPNGEVQQPVHGGEEGKVVSSLSKEGVLAASSKAHPNKMVQKVAAAKAWGTDGGSGKKELTPSSVKSNASAIMSPMDTYELSDRDQSDSESEDEDDGKSKKRIPDWAHKAQLMPALEHQFGRKLHDPDQIFGEVQTCDLEEIFDKKKARYQRRTSSGNWTQDRVTAAEKLAYKRAEGFASERAAGYAAEA